MPDRAKLAKEWFARGSDDMQTARLAFGAGAPTATIAILLQQAAEKYLKGYLIYHGWELRKTHDIRRLMAEAINYDSSFIDFRDFARAVTAYYLEDRYPPGPPADYPREEIAGVMEQAEKLIVKIKEAVG